MTKQIRIAITALTIVFNLLCLSIVWVSFGHDYFNEATGFYSQWWVRFNPYFMLLTPALAIIFSLVTVGMHLAKKEKWLDVSYTTCKFFAFFFAGITVCTFLGLWFIGLFA